MMFRLKKESRRAICALLTAAMLCSDAGGTAYAEETVEQDIFTQNTDVALQEETRAQEEQEKESLEGEPQKDPLQTAEGSQEEASPEEDSQAGNLSIGDGFHAKEFEKEKVETETEDPDAVLAEGSVSENAADEEGCVPENAADMEEPVPENAADMEESVSENDMDGEESVSENDVAAEKNLQAAEKTAENITWEIDANGKLTLTGTGDFSDSTGYDRAPWYERRDEVKTAEVNVMGMTDASYMFYGCVNLTSVDVSGFDTGNVVNMGFMFANCWSLTSLDVSGFATNNVTRMGSMFNGCLSLTSLDLSGFATNNVTRMGSMFNDCWSLTSLDISSFQTGNVADMSWMFYGCSSLTSLDLSGFSTNNVTDMDFMFYDCSSLTSLDVSGFHTGNVKDMSGMFEGCRSLTSLDVSGFSTNSVTDMGSMFSGCSSLTSLDVSGFLTGNVTDMGWMFFNCSGLTSLDVSSFSTSNVTDMESMFDGCSSLTSLNVSGFDTGNVTDMSQMFLHCGRLRSLDVRSFLTDNVTSMRHMFGDCYDLTSLDVSSFDTGNVTDMGSMFGGCQSLISLDVSSFDTDKVTDMGFMFSYCYDLTSLDISGFSTSNVTDMDTMFRDCWSLTSLDLSSFNLGQVENADSFFLECENLITIRTPYNLNVSIQLPTGTWYQPDGTQITELQQGQMQSMGISKNQAAISSAITAEKERVLYGVSSRINTDDLTVIYYDADGMAHKLADGDYQTNADEIDMSTAGKKELVITYLVSDKTYTGIVELTVSDGFIASNVYKDITWSIDANGKLLVEGSGDFSDSDTSWMRTPWYNWREDIRSAEINVSGMTDASYLFYNCSNLKSVDVSGFKTGSVTNMASMFYGCRNLASLDLSGFDTSSVTNMASMFRDCRSLADLNISSFNTGKVTDMSDMFGYCYGLTSLDVSGFHTDNVTDMSGMFDRCYGLTSLDVSGFGTGNVTDMSDMFDYCYGLTSLDVSGFDTGKVTDMSDMFDRCYSLTSLDVSGFHTDNVTDMGGMFGDCSSLTSLDVSNFSTDQVTDIGSMFESCSNLTSLDVSGFHTDNVTDMGGMFYDCSGLTSLDVNNFSTDQVTDMGGMFNSCSSLTSLDLSGFATDKVQSMYGMFDSCSHLMRVDVGGFETSNLTDMSYMFYQCDRLMSLDLSSFNVAHLEDADSMFDGCYSLRKINTPYNLNISIELLGDWYQADGTQIYNLPKNLDHSVVITKDEPSKKIPIESITVSEKFLFLKIGESKKLTVKVTPENATTPAITWKSSDDGIAEAKDGTVTAVSAGKCTITASAGDKMASCEVTVVSGSPTDPTDPTDKTALNTLNTTVTLADTSGYVYDGTAKTPEVTVSYRTIGNTVALEKDKDYTVAYENNINAFEDSLSLLTAQNAPKAVITGIGKYSGTVSKAFTIQKAAAPQMEELSVNIEDYQAGQSGCTLDLSGCFAECQKTGYTAGTPVEDDAVAGSVLAGQPSVDEKGLLTYQTSAGTKGDFAVVPVTVSFLNYKDSAINVKIILGGAPEEAVPVAAPVADPESGRQLAAGSKITLTCGTAGAQIYYTTGASEKELAEPTEASTRYTEPIAIDKDMYIRAATIKGGSRSKTVTFCYTVLTEAGQVMKPYAVPGQGVVEKGTKVELKSDTPDAIIYYVTGKNPDMLGAVPDDDGHKYTDPIELNEDTVIKAVAEKDGMEDSDAAVFVYRVKTEDIKAPAANPVSGNVNQGSYIALTADSDVDIYYTTDGSDPAVSGTARLYEEKIKVLGSAGSKITIRAAAEKKGIYSETITFTYTVSEKKAEGLNVMLAGREEYIYTGSAIKPAVIVTNNGEELTEGEDYTLQYSNNVNAAENTASKAPKVTVKGKGNLTKSRTVTFTIMPKDIGDEEEVVGGSIVVVKGKTAAPVLFYGGVKLTTKDFAFVNPADAKKKYSENGKLLIKGKGNFTGNREIAVKAVDKEDLKKLTVAVDNAALKNKPLVYDGETKTLDGYFKVFDTQDKSKSNPLEEYSDYAVVYPENNINAGKVKFTVVGLGDYSGTVTKSYTITPRVVNEDGLMKVCAENRELRDGNSYPFYNGKGTIPELTVSYEGHELVPGKDYKVSYSGNKKICPDDAKAKCTISFIGNYKGSTSVVRKFKITPAEINDNGQMDETMGVAVGDMVYKKPGAYKSVPYVTADGVLLKTSDYKVSYYKDPQRTQELKGKSGAITLTENETQAPVYVKIEGKGNYQGVMTAQYNVRRPAADAIDLSKAKITVGDRNKAEYTGEKVEPALLIQYKAGGGWQTVSAEDIRTALTVTYINNVNKGKATVMVNGNGGKYVGSKTAVFNIAPKNIQ